MAETQTILTSKQASRHRKQIFAIIGILFSIMMFLSIISYSSLDQASGDISLLEIFKVFTNDETIILKAERTQNWLGLLGAYISNLLINSTIGYSIIILPFLLVLWSLYLLNNNNLRKKIIITNYTITIAILISSFIGLLRILDGSLPIEFSGVIGHFIAYILSKTLGLVGAILVLISGFVIVATLLIDINYKVSFENLKEKISEIIVWLKTKYLIIKNLYKSYTKKADEQELSKNKNAITIKAPEPELQTAINDYKEIKINTPPIINHKSEIDNTTEENIGDVKTDKTDDLEIDIKEKHIESEVDFDERKIEITADKVEEIDYVFPSVDLLDINRDSEEIDKSELEANAELLRSKLADFSVEIDSVSVTPGPVVTLYEIVPATGVKISRIESLQDDIALALKAKGIRIIAPMPGKGTVGVEIPNHKPALVTIRSIINSEKFRDSNAMLPIAMGKSISGEIVVDDLAKMPHLLIAGATGSGKSVGINTILTSLIYSLHPSEVKFVIIDPKKIELTLFKKLSKHYLAVSSDINEEIITDSTNAVLVLKSVELEMENRYNKLAAAGVRHIKDYNQRFADGKLHDTETIKHCKLPFLVVIIDELADLMITAAREVEEPIARLAQLARAVGIHLVVATQRPSVDVITGVIKANFPARIAYQVSSKIDSRTILDMNGADQLLGNGDMLYLSPSSSKPSRIQNAFISTEEVERVTNSIGKQKGYKEAYKLPSVLEKKRQASANGGVSEDELFDEAAKIIVRHQQGSVSLLQRRLKVGYSRAARLIDELEAAGIVGPFDGSKAREVLVETDNELLLILKSLKK